MIDVLDEDYIRTARAKEATSCLLAAYGRQRGLKGDGFGT